MAKLVAKIKSVDNSNLNELDNFIPSTGTTNQTITIGTNTIQRSSVYKNGNLTVKLSLNGTMKCTLKTEASAKELKTLFKGTSWEQKFFDGADTVKGSTAADMLFGFNGRDSINGKAGSDSIYGGKGPDSLHGGGGGDSIHGGAGKDFLNGDAGVNTLTGDGGADTFAFDAALIGGNYSEITDFKAGKDTIELAKSTFTGIGSKGALAAGKFFLASDYAGKAKSVVYDDSNGNLYYAKDGGDLMNAQIFGRIGNGASLDHSDFVIA
jgi:Ca2+-binding RTX toxin-like protein